MNILDTFTFMFQADTTGVEKGMKSGEDATKKLKKAIDDVDMSADKLAANFVNMAKNAAGALAGVLALGAIKSLVNDTAAHTAAVAMQARAIGVSVEQLSSYQAAIVAVGGDSSAAAGTLDKLRDKFVEMSRFGVMVGPDAFMFRQLGLSAKEMQESIKDPTIALGALASKFETLNNTQQLYIGKKLGLDQGTIMLLSQGRRAFDEMLAKQKELNVVTQEQAQAATKYKIAQAELGLTFDTVKREIVTALLPAFTWIVQSLDKLLQWGREHKGFMITIFTGLGIAIGTVLLPPLIAAAAAMWAFIAPMLLAAAPFIALGVAIALVVDDIEKFRKGQNSLIGEILEKWPIVGQIARSIGEIVKMAFKLISDAIGWAAKSVAGAGVDAWNKYKDALTPVVTLFEKLWGWVSKFKDAPGKVLDWIVSGINKVGNGLANITGEHYDNAGGPDSPRQIATPANTVPGREIADKLVASGKWTPAQAAGIAGSFMQESQGQADARNKTSGAYGLGQWLGSRRKDFETWSGKPLEGSSLDDQIQFFNYETNHKEKRAGDRIRAAQTATEAADAHAKYYERPGANEINLARRERYASMIASGQTQIGATNNPLASQSSQSIVTGGASSNRSVTVTGDTHIHTQATDAAGIAAAHGDLLRGQMNDALDAHDDGVLI